jgi:hypothetical protein
MARYRHKDETDLAWNKIRRRITRELDTQIADWREKALNELLTDAWTRYAASLEKGEVLEIAPSLKEFVAGALEQAINLQEAS